MKFLLTTFVAVFVVLSLTGVAFGAGTCPDICTMDYRPVCGKVGDTPQSFPNRCAFEITECNNRVRNKGKVEFLHEGAC